MKHHLLTGHGPGEFEVWLTMLDDVDPADVTAQPEAFCIGTGPTPGLALLDAVSQVEALAGELRQALPPEALSARPCGCDPGAKWIAQACQAAGHCLSLVANKSEP